MPNVPGVAGQLIRKPVAVTTMVQPPPSNDDLQPPQREPEPEPALTAADHIPPTQEQLAALSIEQQNIPKKGMTPNEAPAPIYKFTDKDREEASKARWSKKYDWEASPLDDALSYLAEIRVECERGGLILQKRVSELRIEKVKCFSCDNIINLSEGRWAGMRTRNNFDTGVPESAYACSAACMLKLNREFTHPVQVRQAVGG